MGLSGVSPQRAQSGTFENTKETQKQAFICKVLAVSLTVILALGFVIANVLLAPCFIASCLAFVTLLGGAAITGLACKVAMLLKSDENTSLKKEIDSLKENLTKPIDVPEEIKKLKQQCEDQECLINAMRFTHEEKTNEISSLKAEVYELKDQLGLNFGKKLPKRILDLFQSHYPRDLYDLVNIKKLDCREINLLVDLINSIGRSLSENEIRRAARNFLEEHLPGESLLDKLSDQHIIFLIKNVQNSSKVFLSVEELLAQNMPAYWCREVLFDDEAPVLDAFQFSFLLQMTPSEFKTALSSVNDEEAIKACYEKASATLWNCLGSYLKRTSRAGFFVEDHWRLLFDPVYRTRQGGAVGESVFKNFFSLESFKAIFRSGIGEEEFDAIYNAGVEKLEVLSLFCKKGISLKQLGAILEINREEVLQVFSQLAEDKTVDTGEGLYRYLDLVRKTFDSSGALYAVDFATMSWEELGTHITKFNSKEQFFRFIEHFKINF